MSIIIGLGGEKAVGKDTAAAILVSKHGFERAAFADPLKEMVAFAMALPLARFHDPILKDKARNYMYTIYPHHVNRMIAFSEKEGLELSNEQKERLMGALAWKSFHTPRAILQYVGTEGFRTAVTDTYWLDLFQARHKDKDKLVVTDMRFPNERQKIASMGGATVRIKRGQASGEVHSSEKSLGEDNEYQLVLENNASIDDLQAKLENFYLSNDARSNTAQAS